MVRLLLFAALFLLGGCCAAAPPMTYLHLAPVPGHALATEAGTPITVAHVEMPPSVDRLALTTETGESTLAVDPNASWAAPLDEMATRTLTQDLASRLPRTSVLMPGEVIPSHGVRVVRVDVLRFLPAARTGGALVSLDADWQVLSPGGTVAHDGQSRIGVPSGEGAAASAAAMSTALGRLADEIAAAMTGS